nr:MAG TPA: hypothetical protein [Herelleviridae sp.]
MKNSVKRAKLKVHKNNQPYSFVRRNKLIREPKSLKDRGNPVLNQA